jgi:hypothetical protein
LIRDDQAQLRQVVTLLETEDPGILGDPHRDLPGILSLGWRLRLLLDSLVFSEPLRRHRQ